MRDDELAQELALDDLPEELDRPIRASYHPTQAIIISEPEVLDRLLEGVIGHTREGEWAETIDLGFVQPDYDPLSSPLLGEAHEVWYDRASPTVLSLLYRTYKRDFAAYTWLMNNTASQVRAVRLPLIPTITYPKMFADIHANIRLTLVREGKGVPLYSFTSEQEWKDWISKQVNGRGVPAGDVRRALNQWLRKETRWQVEFVSE